MLLSNAQTCLNMNTMLEKHIRNAGATVCSGISQQQQHNAKGSGQELVCYPNKTT